MFFTNELFINTCFLVGEEHQQGRKQKVADKIQKAKVIITGITAQVAKLPNLPIPVTQLTTLNSDLEQKNTAAASGSHSDVAARNTSEKSWIAAFRATANYVNEVADGNKQFILDCGFDATSSESTPKGNTVALANFVAKPLTTSGSVEISNDGQQDADSYLYMLAPTDTVVQQQGDMLVITMGGKTLYLIPDTHHHTTATGLPSAQKLSAYGVALNLNGTGPVTKTGNDVTPQ